MGGPFDTRRFARLRGGLGDVEASDEERASPTSGDLGLGSVERSCGVYRGDCADLPPPHVFRPDMDLDDLAEDVERRLAELREVLVDRGLAARRPWGMRAPPADFYTSGDLSVAWLDEAVDGGSGAQLGSPGGAPVVDGGSGVGSGAQPGSPGGVPVVLLWLDDVRQPPDDEWTVARTAEEAKAILTAGPVEAASLDHDMGECDECASSFPPRGYRVVTNTCRHRMTGYDLVAWMVETGTWPRFKPAVHSANEVGRARMILAIEQHWRGRSCSVERGPGADRG